LKTLETKNLELKYANRNLISTISEQKNTLKTLRSKINELQASKGKKHNFEKLNRNHKKLLADYKNLKDKYKKSQEEIAQLKELMPESNSGNGLFGRFLKRKSIDEKKHTSDQQVINQQNKKN
jgi:predicted RNase H-like nuclease (RuvC/YqgF family)